MAFLYPFINLQRQAANSLIKDDNATKRVQIKDLYHLLADELSRKLYYVTVQNNSEILAHDPKL